MYFAVTCLDGERGAEIRGSDIRPKHLDYVKNVGDAVKMAGPILNDAGAPIGSQFILELEDEAALKAFLASDPYAQAGLFEAVDVRVIKPLLGTWVA